MKTSIETIARAAHESIRLFNESNGDWTIRAWDDAPEEMKKSTIDGVNAFILNPEINAQQLHDNWKKTKIAAGWKRGPTKNVERKEHPCICPYADLSEREKQKDFIFLAVVKAMASQE